MQHPKSTTRSWRAYLKVLGNGSNGYKGDDISIVKKANESMQEYFPGNYVVEDCFNPQKLLFELRLKFDNPQDETLFLVKYS
jgi:hypothetical protein